ncbi:MAG: acetate--CoA ligase, partial [Psychromonas sp.]
MSENHIFPVTDKLAKNSLMTNQEYLAEYQASINDPVTFWGEKGKILDWIKPYSKVKNTSYDPGHISIKWFEDGELNVSANCIDRHLASKGNQVAILWEGDSPDQDESITYKQLHKRVCQFANALKYQGVKKGDVVCLYMPMTPEAAIAMLACTRIGAVHSIVFGGFSPDAIAGRIIDSSAIMVITADEARRGGRTVPLKANVDQALTKAGTECVQNVIVFKNTGAEVNWVAGRDLDWQIICAAQSSVCQPEAMNAEDPLFILYTSGSTGTPKGVLHTTGGYLVYAAMTFKYVFDYQEGDIYWCTADVGWITGHSYLVYGPLANGATTLLFEGVPNYPTPARMSEVIDKHNVSILYTAPTAIRALMAQGDLAILGTHRSSLRLLGTVGEPINPEAWLWYYNKIGDQRCPIVDTWWQTETGGILITPLPGATALKPGSATRPFFGVQPALVDNEGGILRGAVEG